MKTVHKFPLDLSLDNFVEMPTDSQVLHVAMQRGQLQLWALVDTDTPLRTRTFRVMGTGWGFEGAKSKETPSFHYIGTVIDGNFVWHIFEEVKL